MHSADDVAETEVLFVLRQIKGHVLNVKAQ